MQPLDKGYSHVDVEPDWYSRWLAAGVFRAADQSEKPPFCIVIPPPNVTGHLHMGHALTFAIEDLIIRFRRMAGFNTLWLPGTDHAGIATQMVVERELAKTGTSRFDLGREAFLEEVWRWKDAAHSRIVAQMRALGVSVDWDRERFTLDEGLSRAVRTVFVQLYREGLVYRAQRMVNWSPAIRTVLSDLEVEEKEVKGHLWHIAYPVVGHDRQMIVATTRPETMLGDSAVAVHPDDERYRDLIGCMVRLPLTDREIPIIADAEAVDPTFGTGAVKITPAHDFADFETGLRHQLPVLTILTDDAHMNDTVPAPYRGLERFEARKAVVADLEALGLLIKVEDYTHMVGHCQRSGVIVEPKVSLQWFVRTKPLAEPAIAAVRDGRTRFFPATWEKTYMNWMENIRDWCISRQLWWGHQIPVWYCANPACDGMHVGLEAPGPDARCPKCGGAFGQQDEDVLDTWFSSSLWPFSSLGWPERTEALKTFYPTSVMETGFDIIFFWVARMMMMGLHFMNEVPFRDIYLHAMVRDEHGQKMSKTKGNVIDPLIMVSEVGADALRFTLITMAAQGRDVKLSLDRVQGYREFVNKLWNAARFVFMNLDDLEGPVSLDGLELRPADRWILTRLNAVVASVRDHMEGFRFNEAAQELYQFTWRRFCDWYLELAKGPLNEGGEARRTTQKVLVVVLDHILRALHPFMPFVTEEVWQRLRPFLPTPASHIVTAPYPCTSGIPRFDDEADSMDRVLDVIGAIRTVRSQTCVPPSESIAALLRTTDVTVVERLAPHADAIRRLARLSEWSVLPTARRPEGAAVGVLPFGECYVTVGVERIEAEKGRLGKNQDKVARELEAVRRKLGNEAFVARAPAEVVAAEKDKALELEAMAARIGDALKALQY